MREAKWRPDSSWSSVFFNIYNEKSYFADLIGKYVNCHENMLIVTNAMNST